MGNTAMRNFLLCPLDSPCSAQVAQPENAVANKMQINSVDSLVVIGRVKCFSLERGIVTIHPYCFISPLKKRANTMWLFADKTWVSKSQILYYFGQRFFIYLNRQRHRVVHPVISMDAIAKTLNAFFHQALKIITIIIAEKYFQPTLAAKRYMVNAVQEVDLLFFCRWVNITLLMQVRSLTLLHLSSLFGSHWLAPAILSRPCRSASGTASSQRVHLASADAARAMIRLLSDSARSRGVFLC